MTTRRKPCAQPLPNDAALETAPIVAVLDDTADLTPIVAVPARAAAHTAARLLVATVTRKAEASTAITAIMVEGTTKKMAIKRVAQAITATDITVPATGPT